MPYTETDPEPKLEHETNLDKVFNNAKVLSPSMPMYLDADIPDHYTSFGDFKKNILKKPVGLKHEYNTQKGDTASMCSPIVVEYLLVMYDTTVAGGTFSDSECVLHDIWLCGLLFSTHVCIKLGISTNLMKHYGSESVCLAASTGSGLAPSIVKTILQRYRVPILNDLQGGLEQICLPAKLCCGTEAKLINENGRASATLKDKNGFFVTGDLCIIDQNDVINVIVCIKDTIKYCGNWIQVPSVVDCAVIGVCTPDGEELPTKHVSLVDDIPQPANMEERLFEFAHSRLHQIGRLLDGIYDVKQFPRTAAGNIQKRA
ncbi:hypothetical protein BDA99DRAFT_538538 [Phascolomyces articulosus]|uniref:Uncharacterized protein n=1 Tax=Phascolomyces articulosus TaxID=60185 RepID=A0AAD5KB58_9FUNG|nr:hypothetical protein BDA99DRAFT_538538 [Phascolomyces articulosus]